MNRYLASGRRLKRRGRTLTSLGLGLALATQGPCAAAAPTPEEVSVAQRHYSQARDQQAHHDWVGCENSVMLAIRIAETPGLRFHLAFCKEQQHRWVEALVDYRRAGELVAAGVKAEDVAELLPGATENLERMTPQLTLLLEDMPDDTQLFVDDKPLSTRLLGVPFPVDPGARRVAVKAPGYTSYLQEVNLVPEDRRTLRVQLVKLEPETAPAAKGSAPGAASSREPAALSGMGLILAGEAILALGGLGVGVGFTAHAQGAERDADDVESELKMKMVKISDCDEPGATDGGQCGKYDDLQTTVANDRLVATVGYVTAGAATLGFLVTWLVWPSEGESHVEAAVIDEGRGAFLQWSGRF